MKNNQASELNSSVFPCLHFGLTLFYAFKGRNEKRRKMVMLNCFYLFLYNMIISRLVHLFNMNFNDFN
jgi:hypothetical protein